MSQSRHITEILEQCPGLSAREIAEKSGFKVQGVSTILVNLRNKGFVRIEEGTPCRYWCVKPYHAKPVGGPSGRARMFEQRGTLYSYNDLKKLEYQIENDMVEAFGPLAPDLLRVPSVEVPTDWSFSRRLWRAPSESTKETKPWKRPEEQVAREEHQLSLAHRLPSLTKQVLHDSVKLYQLYCTALDCGIPQPATLLQMGLREPPEKPTYLPALPLPNVPFLRGNALDIEPEQWLQSVEGLFRQRIPERLKEPIPGFEIFQQLRKGRSASSFEYPREYVLNIQARVLAEAKRRDTLMEYLKGHLPFREVALRAIGVIGPSLEIGLKRLKAEALYEVLLMVPEALFYEERLDLSNLLGPWKLPLPNRDLLRIFRHQDSVPLDHAVNA